MNITRERWPALLDRRQACEYLQLGESTFKSLRATGRLKSVRITNSLIRYRRSDLDRFIESLEEGEGVSPNDR